MALQSFNQILAELAQNRPDKKAIICEDKSLTYKQLDLQSSQLAWAYRLKGVKANDLVTVALGNGLEFFTVCVALWKLGATPQPVSYRLPKKELQAIVKLAQSSLVVGVDQALLPDHACIPPGFSPDPSLPDSPLSDIIAKAWKAPTSGGSTGRPKLIVSGDTAELDVSLDSVVRIPRDQASLIPGPLYHNGPFITAMHSLLRGNQVIVMTKFDCRGMPAVD